MTGVLDPRELDDPSDQPARIERRHVAGGLLFLVGALCIAGVIPNISETSKSFAFEPPPDAAKISFNPRTLVGVIAGLYIVAAVLTFLPSIPERVARLARLGAAVLFLPLILAIALALSERGETNVTNLLAESLILSTPFALGAMTGLWSERSGIINIGIEGMMLTAAGVGYMTYAITGNASGTGWMLLAILISVLAGGLMAALLAVLAIRFQINQIIAGVVINLFALGLTGFLRSEVIVPSGASRGVATASMGLWPLSEIPIVGDQLFRGKPLYFCMYLVVFLTWLVMFRTAWGLRVRSCGENPHAAETLGIDVVRVRYQAVILGGFIAGLGGAWFSLDRQAGFEDNMTNAAGFIALAAMIFGKWTPWGAFGGALLFGFSQALGSRLQSLDFAIAGFSIPSEFLQSLPFIVTIVVVAGALGRAIPPAAEGQPFRPSG